MRTMKTTSQPLTWGLVQAGLDVQTSAVSIAVLWSGLDGILLGSSITLRLLVINLASVQGGQLVNSPTAAILNR